MRSPLRTPLSVALLSALGLVAAPAATVSFTDSGVLSYGGSQDAGGTATVSADGTTVSLSGNTWKAVVLPYEVTADTILSFEFRSDNEGISLAVRNGTFYIQKRPSKVDQNFTPMLVEPVECRTSS